MASGSSTNASAGFDSGYSLGPGIELPSLLISLIGGLLSLMKFGGRARTVSVIVLLNPRALFVVGMSNHSQLANHSERPYTQLFAYISLPEACTFAWSKFEWLHAARNGRTK